MAETFTFQAEIQQLLDILVHSLYTERDIFLRELISNASDALNRVQFELLTNHDILDPEAELAIEIKADEAAGTLTISDTGIGMTKDELANNLGVIARSGAKAFIEAMKESKNGSVSQDVIGQFGVGFYSVFMVADKVRVVSRSYKKDDKPTPGNRTGGPTYSHRTRRTRVTRHGHHHLPQGRCERISFQSGSSRTSSAVIRITSPSRFTWATMKNRPISKPLSGGKTPKKSPTNSTTTSTRC